MPSAAIASPPVDMSTPQTTETVVLVVLGALVVVALAAAVWDWRRSGRPFALLLTLGGATVSLNEPLVDLLGHCYFPHDGWISHTFFDYAVPVWVVFAYVLFFGAFVHLQYLQFRRGASYRRLWGTIAAFWVANVLLEIPILATDLYEYYGDQPLAVGGFPLVWLTVNCLGAFAAAVVVVRYEAFFTGVRALFLLVVCYGTYMASWVVSMPHFWALNADASEPVRIGATIVSFALGAWAIDSLIRLGLRGPATVAADRRSTTAAPPQPARAAGSVRASA